MKIFKTVLLLYFVTISLFAQQKVEKYHRAKIIYNSSENNKKLEKQEVPMNHVIHKIN